MYDYSIELYFGFFSKKIYYTAIDKKFYQFGFWQHIENIIKSKAHKQIKQSDYVLFCTLKILLKRFLKGCNKSHLFWKLRCGKGKEGSPQPLRERRGVNL